MVLSRLMKKVERKKKQSKLKGDKTEVKMLTIRPELQKEFKGHSVSPEIIMMFVYMKLRFSLSYRDLEERVCPVECVNSKGDIKFYPQT